MPENTKEKVEMEEVTVLKKVMFDGKERKPGTTLTVSAGEAENLRRIEVIAEKKTGKDKDEKLKNPPPPPPDYIKMNKKELLKELKKRNMTYTSGDSKAKMRVKIAEFDKNKILIR